MKKTNPEIEKGEKDKDPVIECKILKKNIYAEKPWKFKGTR